MVPLPPFPHLPDTLTTSASGWQISLQKLALSPHAPPSHLNHWWPTTPPSLKHVSDKEQGLVLINRMGAGDHFGEISLVRWFIYLYGSFGHQTGIKICNSFFSRSESAQRMASVMSVTFCDLQMLDKVRLLLDMDFSSGGLSWFLGQHYECLQMWTLLLN
jgi:hypothetical protein